MFEPLHSCQLFGAHLSFPGASETQCATKIRISSEFGTCSPVSGTVSVNASLTASPRVGLSAASAWPSARKAVWEGSRVMLSRPNHQPKVISLITALSAHQHDHQIAKPPQSPRKTMNSRTIPMSHGLPSGMRSGIARASGLSSSFRLRNILRSAAAF
jgi:hypothetical protein